MFCIEEVLFFHHHGGLIDTANIKSAGLSTVAEKTLQPHCASGRRINPRIYNEQKKEKEKKKERHSMQYNVLLHKTPKQPYTQCNTIPH